MYLKKFFNEGVLRLAILLSVCGVWVDVGLEPYLPAGAWLQQVGGPSLALSHARSHNLRNLRGGQEGAELLPPKSIIEDDAHHRGSRRLLSWVRSLDRMQVPGTELEAWLVQREPDLLPPHTDLQRPPLVQREPPHTDPQMDSAPAGLEGEQQEEEELKEDGALTDDTPGVPGGPPQAVGVQGVRGGPPQAVGVQGVRGGPPQAVGVQGVRGGPPQAVGVQGVRGGPPQAVGVQGVRGGPPQAVGVQGVRGGPPQAVGVQGVPGGPPLVSSSDLELQWEDVLSILETEDMEVDSPETQLLPGDQRRLDAALGFHDNQHSALIGRDVSLQRPGDVLDRDPPPPPPPPSLMSLTPSDQLDPPGCTPPSQLLWDPNPGCTPQPPQLFWDPNPGCTPQPPPPQILWDDVQDPSLWRPPSDHLSLLDEDPPLSFGLSLEDPFSMDLLSPSLGVPGEGDPMESAPQTPPHDHTPLSEEEELPSPLGDLLQEAAILDEEVAAILDEEVAAILDEEAAAILDEEAAILDGISLLDLALEEDRETTPTSEEEEAESYLEPETVQSQRLESGRYDDDLFTMEEEDNDPGYHSNHQQQGEVDSDSGLSLDSSRASPCVSETSYYSSSSSASFSSSSGQSEEEEDGRGLAARIKQEEEEVELGAVGGGAYWSHVAKNPFDWLERVGHDHTYNQPCKTEEEAPPTAGGKRHRPAPSPPPPPGSPRGHAHSRRQWSLDERRARLLRIPFSNEHIVNLPVDDFNELLARYHLDDQQLSLVKDIRRRGKNKMAAQNCRKRKLDVLVGLEQEVTSLRRRKSRLQRHRQDALRDLQEMKRRLGALYQEVLQSVAGGPLGGAGSELHFGPDGSVTLVDSRREHGGQERATAAAVTQGKKGETARKQRRK